MPKCKEVLGDITKMAVTGAGTLDFADQSIPDRTVFIYFNASGKSWILHLMLMAITLTDLDGTPLVTFAAAEV